MGHGPELERDGAAANVLRQLGAQIRTADLWDDPAGLFEQDSDVARAVVIDAGARPDIGGLVVRKLRREPRLEGVGMILAIDRDRVSSIDPTAGFDDFVLAPLIAAELYTRIRSVEWKRSEFTTEERVKMGGMVIDRAAREVTKSGELIILTAREFDLLSYLADRRGKVVSRTELLERVWGTSYEGGPRTIDIHVRRLRAKLGVELDLTTFRRSGYRLGAPVQSTKKEV